jgi:hypothetical protein
MSRVLPAVGLAATASVVSACLCCTGGLTDTLSPPAAIASLSATVLFGAAAMIIGMTGGRRPLRAVHDEVTARLDRLVSSHAGVLREDGTPATVTAYRVDHVGVDWSDGDTEATAIATLTFDDGTPGRLIILLLPYRDGWRVEAVEGSDFRLELE